MKRFFLTFALAGVMVMAVALPGAYAQTFTLTDLNSRFDINVTPAGGGGSGAFNWVIDGQDQLFEQGFWWRVGNTAESRVNALQLTGVAGFLGTRGVQLNYADQAGRFTIEVTYLLTGGTGGSFTSDVGESIRIINTSGGALDMHFFQYSDFDLNQTFAGDFLRFANANTVQQWDPNGRFNFSETVVTPPASHYEGATFPSIRNRLDDNVATTLTDTPGIGATLFGDMTWAYQWDQAIAVGDALLISKDKHMSVIPEPATLLLLGAGLLGAGFASRRRKKA